MRSPRVVQQEDPQRRIRHRPRTHHGTPLDHLSLHAAHPTHPRRR
ncbi:hypothetical protein SCATT_p07850 (plasmid) [Streptantibioticus cattleyicolor NRRL 8057 = DSM 46488]|uniref:Uncharacterized protein n=1 Tax=Streptantibioticus cattleyicolor (strain ATCC 35852 / DSM 46488 / JCM 4925 / NBRC 14057 / NRRL 8057) TaxID=1003195 RepID=G8XHW4_STREN|nr:hypothetical protein SCATT_p07850 [Streptantibioticus cattleyicolor NRRL 8057 = DSM 46488]